MKKLQPLGIIILCLNILVIAAGIAIGSHRLDGFVVGLMFILAPIFCFWMAWRRVKRAPSAMPSNKANITALALIGLFSAAGAFGFDLAGSNSMLVVASVVYLFFSFSADIVFENR